ncbi:substrate-binding domain-containing protein [Crossiella sp. CA-258035]|uniref:substrate-binding domain-containing protein n=1 Tax=Crossiella sp. CA-258035 TaxID=2981138 RepID=UPI0024BCC5B3|nr:substrate-binding domain-containing protein [Crossiella sp. CA-258035]WHT22465.1 substrate-binding domain-containing protein [Crossiella sp. CA-258035]
MREPGEARRQRILAAVQARGAVRVSDLAAELDVSVVTARRDVEELARLGALRRGHGVARSLTTRDPAPAPALPEGGAIALVVPERHAYLHETMHGARTALEAAGQRVVLHIAPQPPGAERPIVERLLAQDIRGLLIAPRWRTTQAELNDAWLAEIEVPLVLMERRPWPGSRLHALDSVCTDHWYGMHLAVEHLVSLGHRRIVLAARDDSPTARALRAAFAEIASYRAEIEDWTVLLSAADAGPGPEGGAGGAVPGGGGVAGVAGPDGVAGSQPAVPSAAAAPHTAAPGAAVSPQASTGPDGAAPPLAASEPHATTEPSSATAPPATTAPRATDRPFANRRPTAPTHPGAITTPIPADPHATPPSELAAILRARRSTAVILHGDVDALILVQQLADAGLRVPQDCSVVAYDDVVAALGSPPLTAVAPPKAEVGRVAAELLLTRLASGAAWRTRRVELLPDLMVRGSTRRI